MENTDFLEGDNADPAADFLAREQEDLGEWGEELGLTKPVAEENGINEGFEVVPPTNEENEEKQRDNDDNDDDLGSAFSPNRTRPTEEPETIRKWKMENASLLEAKDEKEREMKEELRQRAQKELEDWYKHYEEQLKKTKDENRQSQKEFVAEINDIAPGTEWERVHKLCDFNTKTNKNSKDMSRMRSILLQLKQTQAVK